MSYTLSKMLPLGTKAPDFSLLDTVSGKTVSLSDAVGAKGTVIIFSCNHCPYVHHVNDEIVQIANEYRSNGVNFVIISSNDVVNYPQDSPDKMTQFAAESGYTFPYLYDATQSVAKAYDAACTPDFYVFNEKVQLAYRGQIDDSRPNSGIPVTGKDLRAALDAIITGGEVAELQYPGGGCNIKWKK